MSMWVKHVSSRAGADAGGEDSKGLRARRHRSPDASGGAQAACQDVQECASLIATWSRPCAPGVSCCCAEYRMDSCLKCYMPPHCATPCAYPASAADMTCELKTQLHATAWQRAYSSTNSQNLHDFSTAGAMSGMKIPKNMKGGKMPNMHMDVNQMSRMIPPHMLQMMGGASKVCGLHLIRVHAAVAPRPCLVATLRTSCSCCAACT